MQVGLEAGEALRRDRVAQLELQRRVAVLPQCLSTAQHRMVSRVSRHPVRAAVSTANRKHALAAGDAAEDCTVSRAAGTSEYGRALRSASGGARRRCTRRRDCARRGGARTPTSWPVALAEGSNRITATVTAEDGTTTQTYTVTVTRAAAVAPLTAPFGSAPASHGGSAFTVRLRFTGLFGWRLCIDATAS